jgi:hypothetical protein
MTIKLGWSPQIPGTEERFLIQPLYRDNRGYLWQRLRNGTWGSTDRLRGPYDDLPPAEHGPYSVICCTMHSNHCEPPSELCCWECSEARHPGHPAGVACTWNLPWPKR